VTVSAERHNIVERESASTFGQPPHVVGLDLLRASAVPTAIAVSTLGYLAHLLPLARASSLGSCTLGTTLPAPLPLVGTPALLAGTTGVGILGYLDAAHRTEAIEAHGRPGFGRGAIFGAGAAGAQMGVLGGKPGFLIGIRLSPPARLGLGR
jgi:hypothetical protein